MPNRHPSPRAALLALLTAGLVLSAIGPASLGSAASAEAAEAPGFALQSPLPGAEATPAPTPTANREPHANAGPHVNADAHANADTHRCSYTKPPADSEADSVADTDTEPDTNIDSVAHGVADAEANADAEADTAVRLAPPGAGCRSSAAASRRSRSCRRSPGCSSPRT